MSDFIQGAPQVPHPYNDDDLLQSLLARFFPKQDLTKIESELKRFSNRLLSECESSSNNAELNPPVHTPYDPWGKRIDQIVTAPGWESLRKFSVEEKLIADAYLRPYGDLTRLLQFIKIFLFHPSSAFFTCPLAMSDGAARLLELHGSEDLKQRAFKKLTSTDPSISWTSGQWMTEAIGGSDVSESQTIARFENGQWRLYGKKWFTSAITSEMAMVLARVEEKGKTIAGSGGLALFYLEMRNQNNELNHLKVLRLKEKLGTKALPTAELLLEGCIAEMIAPAGAGVKTISALFNITRIYNACTSLGSQKRLLSLALDYAEKRHAFGQKLIEKALHQRTLAKLTVDYHGLFHLTFYLTRLQGLDEVAPSDRTHKLLRLLTPVAKLMTAKINMQNTSELIECFGGAGYIENTGLPKFLRDSQVLCIWEGTTNILSLDTLRAIIINDGLSAFMTELTERQDRIDESIFRAEKNLHLAAMTQLKDWVKNFDQLCLHSKEANSRDLAWSLGQMITALLLLEHGQETQNPSYIQIAKSYFLRKLWIVRDDQFDPHEDKLILSLK